jgi:hypothetical protein
MEKKVETRINNEIDTPPQNLAKIVDSLNNGEENDKSIEEFAKHIHTQDEKVEKVLASIHSDKKAE